MTTYRRVHVPGATWFFTVALAERRDGRPLVEHIDTLRSPHPTAYMAANREMLVYIPFKHHQGTEP